MDAALLDCLLDPACYPEPTGSVEHLQTHISHIFLTDQYAYKIKKPVDFGFLDFTTLEKRRFYCYEELRLNRRLSPDIYLGVVALRRRPDGSCLIDGDGPVVEYAVQMRRLPQERIMARLLERGMVGPEEIEAVARTVADFHATAARGGGIERFGSVEAIRASWHENLQQTVPYIGRTLSGPQYAAIDLQSQQFLDRQAPLLEQRLREGFIRECDGDLHCENICLDGAVHIFDCIEFNEAFRCCDTAADVAFLAMDIENHGRRDLAELFVRTYGGLSGDLGLSQVLPLYLANRAFVRGKVESFRLDDPLIQDEEKQRAAERAARFFRLCHGYLMRPRLPLTMVLTCGPTGCGKSAIAAELAFQLGIEYVSSDVERKRLAGVASTVRDAPIYTDAWNTSTYRHLFERAEACLNRQASVIVDATFRSREERARFLELAAAAGACAAILYPRCSAELIRRRLQERQQRGTDVSDGTWEVYQQQIARFEPPGEDEACLLRPDAALPVHDATETVVRGLGLWSG